MIKFKFKFVGFIISFLTAILVITNGNGGLFQNALGDSDSIEDSVDEIVESAEDEGDQAREQAEDLAEEAKEDTDDEARDRDSEESKDDKDNEDESDDRNEDDSDDAFSDLESEIEDEVREIKDNIVKDGTDESPGVGEGSGMQIFVSPRERVNEILDQHLDNIEEQVSNPPPTSAPGGVGSPGDIPAFPHLDLTFDEDINNLSPGDGNEGNHIFLSPIFGGLATGPGGNDDGNNPPPGFNIPPCIGITFCDPDNGQNNGLQGTNPSRFIDADDLDPTLNILFSTGGVSASSGGLQGTNPGGVSEDLRTVATSLVAAVLGPLLSPTPAPGGVGASPSSGGNSDSPIIFFEFDGVAYAFKLNSGPS